MSSAAAASSDTPLAVPNPDRANFASVRETFRGKHVLITGASGFLGKCLVEKILREIPDVGGLHLLVRPRKGFSTDERMQQEIVQSEIFTRLRASRPDFDSFMRSKLHAVPGELTQENCGMSKETLEGLYSTLDIILHCAAVVDFNERIDRAIELNVMGAVRLMHIAQRCPKLTAFLHTSTCYVNCNLPNGWIDERLPPLPFNPQEVIDKVRRMNVAEMAKITDTGLLRDWPNTYTFTKAIAENMVVRNRGKVPLVILRPSIVGGAWTDPTPGWCDVISAAGAVYMSVGLGVLKFLPGDPNNVADIVPVDVVINSMLNAIPVINHQDRYFICHAATSCSKPLRWALPIAIVPKFFQQHPPKKRLSKAEFSFLRSPQNYQLQFFLRYSVPSSMLNVLAAVAPSSANKSKAHQVERLVWRVRVLIETFRHFVENQWQFSNRNSVACWSVLSPEEKRIFNVDLTDLDWVTYTNNYCFGLMRYVLKEDLVEVVDNSRQLGVNDHAPTAGPVSATQNLMEMIAPDMTWAMQNYEASKVYSKTQTMRSVESMRKLVLSAAPVRAAIEAHVKVLSAKNPRRGAKLEDAQSEAVKIFDKLCGQTSLPVIAGMGYMLRKIWRRLYENIHVDLEGLQAIRELSSKGGPLLFMPTHRSYLDFLVISYICFTQGLPIPCIAAGEDFLGILLVRWLFRNSGAFFIRRSFSDDKLYSAIFAQYIEQLLVDGHSLEFFIEGTRSRSGKMLQPKTGMLSVVSNVLLERKVSDMHLIPISINYERTMESTLYSSELLGERKIKESLRNLLLSSPVLNSNFGNITVRFSTPISMRQFSQGFLLHQHKLLSSSSSSRNQLAVPDVSSEALAQGLDMLASSATSGNLDVLAKPSGTRDLLRRGLVRSLAFRLVHELNVASECMPTHLVASLMLMYRQGVTREHLIKKVEWLRKEIISRGGRVALMQGYERSDLVDNAVKHLGSALVQRRSNVFEANISERSLYHNMLGLGHYRNKIAHLFFREGMCAVALYARLHNTTASSSKVSAASASSSSSVAATASSSKAIPGVSRQQLISDVDFLASMLDREFIYRPSPDHKENPADWLQMMQDRGILAVNAEDDMVHVAPSGEAMYSFLCSLFWPFVDSYYTAAMILFSLQPSKTLDEPTLLHRTQWLASTLYHDQMICFYESCSIDTLHNALATLQAWKVTTLEKPGRRGQGAANVHVAAVGNSSKSAMVVRLTESFQSEEKLQELVSRIDFFRKPPPVRRSLSNSHRSSLVAEMPILAKL